MNKKYTVGGLFSGIGGIELGFQNSGFQIIWGNENDPACSKTYKLNFDHLLFENNIQELSSLNLKVPDVLVAGFPCQPFSIAGHRKGFEDNRGNLFFQIIRLIDEFKEKPKVLFLENVKNFYTHDNKKTFKRVYSEIENRGYSIFHKILNTSDYTKIPQNRERIFIICFRDEGTLWSMSNNAKCSIKFDELFPPPKVKNNSNFREFLEKKKVDDKYYYNQDKYMYSVLKKKMINKDIFYQWRRKYLRENKSNLCPAFTASMGTGGHNVPLIKDDYGFRKLTPSECFKLQGYDKSFKIPKNISNAQLYKQIGNTVTVKLIEILAKIIKISLDEKY